MEREFGQEVSRLYPRLLRFVLKHSGKVGKTGGGSSAALGISGPTTFPPWAFDIVQEALAEAWRSLPSYKGTSSFSTWLHAILNHTLRDRLSTRHPDKQYDDRFVHAGTSHDLALLERSLAGSPRREPSSLDYEIPDLTGEGYTVPEEKRVVEESRDERWAEPWRDELPEPDEDLFLAKPTVQQRRRPSLKGYMPGAFIRRTREGDYDVLIAVQAVDCWPTPERVEKMAATMKQSFEGKQVRAFIVRYGPPAVVEVWLPAPPIETRRGRRRDVRFEDLMGRTVWFLQSKLDSVALRDPAKLVPIVLQAYAEYRAAFPFTISNGKVPTLTRKDAQRIVQQALRRRAWKNELLYGLLAHRNRITPGSIRGVLERPRISFSFISLPLPFPPQK